MTMPIQVSSLGVILADEEEEEVLQSPEVTTLIPGQERGRKPRARTRPKTLSMRRQSKRELERMKQLYPDLDYARPMSRADCQHGPHAERPCPFVSCKHHLYLDVNERNGNIKLNMPHIEVWEMPETCALDVADRGGITLEEVGAIMNLTRERIRQLEDLSLARLKALKEMTALADYVEY